VVDDFDGCRSGDPLAGVYGGVEPVSLSSDTRFTDLYTITRTAVLLSRIKRN